MEQQLVRRQIMSMTHRGELLVGSVHLTRPQTPPRFNPAQIETTNMGPVTTWTELNYIFPAKQKITRFLDPSYPRTLGGTNLGTENSM